MRTTKMKKSNRLAKTVYIALLVALVIGAIPATALAAGSVTYQGAAKGFIFSPGSDSSPTDLFANFKDVVPGDTVTDTIDVKNAASGDIKVYLRALGAGSGSEDFLSQMNLKVTKKGGGTLFDATADQKGGLSNWVLLGTLKKGGSVTLDLTLTVPIEMGDAYQDAIGDLTWQFKVEDSAGKAASPKTGDQRGLPFYLAILLAAGVCVSVIGTKRMKQA